MHLSNKMSYFVVNHSHKQIYKLENWRQTFDEVMDINPSWGMKDDVECYDDDAESIQQYLRLDYTTNFGVYEFPQYIQDPEFLVWYMDTHGFSMYDISRAVNVWEGKPEFRKAHDAIDDLIAWKNEVDGMSGEKEQDDETMLCERMTKAM